MKLDYWRNSEFLPGFIHQQDLERFACQCKGSAALLEGDCGVADARQETTLSVLGPCRARNGLQAIAVTQAHRMRCETPAPPLHSPPINTADRFATLTLTRKPL
jgi:hypothetical protein